MNKISYLLGSLAGTAHSPALDGLVNALSGAGIACVVFDPDGKLIACNEAFLNINEDIRHHIVPGVTFDRLIELAADNRSIGDNSADQWASEKEKIFRTPSGIYEERHANGKVYRSEDFRTKDGYYIGLRYDVTEAEETRNHRDYLEHRFESLAELSSDFFWEMDAELRFHSFHGKGKENAFSDAIGRQRWESATQADLEDVVKWQEHQACLDAREPFRNFEFEIDTKPPKWMRVSGDPLFSTEGVFTCYIGTAIDITDQIINRIRLEESEARFRNLVEGSVQGLLVHVENKPVYVNPAVAKMLGYSVEEILAFDSLECLFTEKSLPRHKAYSNARMMGLEVPENYETEWVRKDGEVIVIRHVSQLIEWEGQQAIQATILDVTAEKQAAAETLERERRFRALADGLPINVVYVDRHRRYRFINNAYLDFYKTTADQILGKSVEEVMGTNAYETVRDRIGAALSGIQQNFEIDIDFVPAGRKRVQSIYVPHRNDNDDVIGIYGLVIDITRHVEAEQAARESEIRYSRMLAIAPDAIVATDKNLTIRVFNRGAETVFGYSSEEVIGKHLNLLLPERYHLKHAAHVRNFLEDREDSRMMSERSEIFGCRRDGSEFPAEASISKIEIGEEIVLTVMLHDITDRKETEAELISAKEKAEYADRSKSEFLANMSHELRTPLNAIIGFADMMHKETFGPLGDDHYYDYAEGIHESGGHLLSMINDILDLSKIEAGRLELYEERLTVQSVVEDCLKIISPRARQAELDVQVTTDHNLPALMADSRLLKQMLLNLLSNAVKFTNPGGNIHIDATIAANGELLVSVSDTGIGIAEEDMEKAMATFGQVDGTLSRRYEGSGLGLPLVKSHIEAHGGQFELTSQPGVGTKATLKFPAPRVQP